MPGCHARHHAADQRRHASALAHGRVPFGILLAAIGGLSCGASPSAEKPAAPARIYVTNQLDNTASVIDGATHKVVATVRVGVSPAQTALSPDRKSVYIANTGSNTVSVLNTDNDTIPARTPAPHRPL